MCIFFCQIFLDIQGCNWAAVKIVQRKLRGGRNEKKSNEIHIQVHLLYKQKYPNIRVYADIYQDTVGIVT